MNVRGESMSVVEHKPDVARAVSAANISQLTFFVMPDGCRARTVIPSAEGSDAEIVASLRNLGFSVDRAVGDSSSMSNSGRTLTAIPHWKRPFAQEQLCSSRRAGSKTSRRRRVNTDAERTQRKTKDFCATANWARNDLRNCFHQTIAALPS